MKPEFFRRRLLRKTLFAAGLIFLCTRLHAEDQPAETVKIQMDPNVVISRISPDFIGFGYETSAAAQSNYFTASNEVLVRLYRNLSPHGLIRIGGNVSDHTRYAPDAPSAPRAQDKVTVINRRNLADLAGFTQAAGWKIMWGLNLGTGSKEEAVQEAMAVNAVLGGSLQSFQIGNEVEALRRFDRSYEAYHAAFLDYKTAIRVVLPDAPFSGPDSIGNLTWVTNFAATEARDTKLLTIHYYRGGAGDPKSTLQELLQRDGRLEKRLQGMREICQARHLAFRINEVNSFSGGGKLGVSDTFASALWCLDFMFRAASYGCDGVNLQTDINHLAWISHYSPIVHDATGHCSARPEYYGMLAFATAGHGEMVQLTMAENDPNLTAYATKDEKGLLWLTVVNKNFFRDAGVQAAMPAGYAAAEVFRLQAPSMESKDHVTFATTEVSADGQWTPSPPEKLAINGGSINLIVPHASAALVCLRP